MSETEQQLTPFEDPAYRNNAGVVIMNEEGKIFVCERADTKGSWQMPQGGIDEGEDTLEAARRELFEETGIPKDDVELIALHPDWLTYEWDKKNRRKGADKEVIGVAQKWFLFKYKGDDESIDLKKAKDKEFTAWKWDTPDSIIENVYEMRKEVYEDVFKTFKKHIDGAEEEYEAPIEEED